MDEDRLRLQGREREALHVQSAAVHRRQEFDPAGLCHLRAVRGREARATSSRTSSCSPTTATPPTRRRSRRARKSSPRSPTSCSASSTPPTIGWYHYLYGDNTKANALIKKDNPEMTDEQIAFSIAKMKEYGLVDSGDTLKLGIGAMTDARIKDFYDTMVKAGVDQAGSRLQEGLHAAIRRQGRRPRSSARSERGAVEVSVASMNWRSASPERRPSRRLPQPNAARPARRRRQVLRQRRRSR